MRPFKLAPSIMTADFTRLGAQVQEAVAAGVDRIHLDIMDGNFVPNISFGPLVPQSLRAGCPLPFEAHLMINNADQYLEPFFKAGVDSVILHIEACPQIENTIKTVRQFKKQVGVTLNPKTPLASIEHLIPSVDLLLIMSVQPGFGGQSFLPGSLEKIKQARQLIDKLNPGCELEVDGGIHLKTLKPAYDAGAHVFVVGSSVYNSQASVAENVRQLTESVHAR
ncbi:MAG TPA: ribulose-phosphate 3-epimerase [Gemmatales bacterium]|nr:ribulose-phosphate 3-epimerase [Gemmatales bacterium]